MRARADLARISIGTPSERIEPFQPGLPGTQGARHTRKRGLKRFVAPTTLNYCRLIDGRIRAPRQ